MKEKDETQGDPADIDVAGEKDRDADPYRQFLADRRHLRFEDTESNWQAIEGYLAQHDLPVSPCSLALSFEQLSQSGDLELIPLGRERAADERTEAEVRQAESAEQAEPQPTVAKDASAMAKIFRSRGEVSHYRNGRRIGAHAG